jgi:tetratricopeptide (TPR) repeat protein
MPSHIFTRVGYWQESIDTNATAARVAKADKSGHDQLHAMDYEVYAYLQLGQDARAKGVIDEMTTVSGFSETFLGGPFALAASPARYAVERGDWKSASGLEVRPSPLPYVPAVSWFAKALGAARSGDTAAAQADIDQLVKLRVQLREKKDAYWSEQIDIQVRVATAWTQFALGHQDEALKMLADAADAEDRTEKHPVTPGPLAPARELYGVMLLEHGNAADALVAFETTMHKEPNRLNATLGAARAAEASGDKAKARQYYAAAAAQASDPGADRPQLIEARAYVARVN